MKGWSSYGYDGGADMVWLCYREGDALLSKYKAVYSEGEQL